MATAVTLNEYLCTDSNGTATKIVAGKMEEAVSVYAEQLNEDPNACRLSAVGVRTVQPVGYTTFATKVYSADGLASSAGCKATPSGYTVKGGSTVLFEAIPVDGYKFSKWSINGTDVTGDEGKKALASLTIPASDDVVEVTATFVTAIGG